LKCPNFADLKPNNHPGAVRPSVGRFRNLPSIGSLLSTTALLPGLVVRLAKKKNNA
jgi:hypothetical protein